MLKRFKRNVMFWTIHRIKGISTNIDAGSSYVIDIFPNADYPLCFINNIGKDFIKRRNDLKDLHIKNLLTTIAKCQWN